MIRRLFLLLLVLFGAYLLYEAYRYVLVSRKLPVGTTIAEVDVGALSLVEATETVANAYGQPIAIYNDEVGERVEIQPAQLGFELNLDEMIREAETQQNEQEWWIGFVGHLLRSSVRPINIPLLATHDETLLLDVVSVAADVMDDPPLPPRVEPETGRFLEGKDGLNANIDASIDNVEVALYSLEDRSAELVLDYADAPILDINLLKTVLEDQMLASSSLVGSIFIRDLQSGDELHINSDLALSGMSIIKIAILLETYRAIDGPPTFDQQKLINETAIFSGNFSANLLLDVVAGQDNAYLGSDILTESLHRLGLINTFLVTPYEEPPRPGRTTLITPANSVPDLVTDPDPNMQTTAEDMGSLLTMIYECSKGGGALLALYADQLSSSECQAVLDALVLNTEGNLIRFGVPEDVPVSHKHGWATNTHGDAGVVFTEGGDYVIVTYLTEPGSDWLVADFSFPLMWELSRIVYNYFNYENPYLESTVERATAVQQAAEAEAAAAAAEAEAENALEEGDSAEPGTDTEAP